MKLSLDERERGMRQGRDGPALQEAMKLVVKAAEIMDAPYLIDISFAHLDSCFYIGTAHLDFAKRFQELGAIFPTQTWTNASLHSKSCPALRPAEADAQDLAAAAELMKTYEAMGAVGTFTCAPYDMPKGPLLGDDIVVGESNAVSFYNSVEGCKTNKYGDYLDVACALVGKAPYAGLHIIENRRATLQIDCSAVPESWRRDDLFPHLLGFIMGSTAGSTVPALTGLLADIDRAGLKAICSAGATSGGVELWHGVGITPEAPDLASVFSGKNIYALQEDDIRDAYAGLTSAKDGPISAVALGTPHFSLAEFINLRKLLGGRKLALGLTMIVSTGRFVRLQLEVKGWLAEFTKQGIIISNDVCTYYNPVIPQLTGHVMTNAAKWAYYAPGMIGAEVSIGSLKECVESAVLGEVWRDPSSWRG